MHSTDRKNDDTTAAEARGPRVRGWIPGAILVATLAACTALALPGRTTPPIEASPLAESSIAESPFGDDSLRCGAPSPALERLAERYPELDVPGLAPARGKVLPSLEAALRDSPGVLRARALTLSHLQRRIAEGGFRGGEGVRVQCFDADDPYPVTWRFDLQQLEVVDTLAEGRMLTAFESRHEVDAPHEDRRVAGTLVAERLMLPERSDLGVDLDARALVGNARFRRRGAGSPNCRADAGRCTSIGEIAWRSRIVGGSVEIMQRFYVNGRTAGWVTWRLDG